jgi:tyrosine-protein kinase Etk/Wzc
MNAFQGKRRGAEESGSNVIRKMIFRYLPYWPLYAAILVLSVICAVVYLRYAVPVYEATATILIKDEKKGMDNSQLLQGLDMLGSSKIVENETEVISSRQLLRQVVSKLHLYAPVIQEGKIVSRSAYTSSPISVEVREPELIRDPTTDVDPVAFTYDDKKKLVYIEGKSYPLDKWGMTPYGELKFIPNINYRKSDNEDPFKFQLRSVKKVVNSLVTRLVVVPSSKTGTVLTLSLQDEVPKRGEDILNELISAYNTAAINDKNVLATNTLNFVKERLRFVVNELDSVESRLQQFKTTKGIVDISEQGKQFLATVGTNDQRISELNVQLAVLDQVQSYVNGRGAKDGIVPSTLGVNDPLLTQLLDKLYTAETEYDRLRKTTAENNPILTTIADQIARLKPTILENLAAQRRNLEASKRNISSSTTQYSSMLRNIPTNEKELLEISRQQSIKNNIYTFLLQKREETALSYASTVADSRLIDDAESSIVPVSPKKGLILLVAILLGLFIATAIIIVKEVLNRNVLFRAEIEELTNTPIIAEISQDNTKEPLVIGEGKRNHIAEEFRQLRTSLGYMGINARKKKVLLTSTITGEGKSFICANLGVSLALTGKKVVIIELDLRKPALSNIVNVSRETGITNYFIGDKEADEIIKRTPVNENLFIIPSGPIPPNPSELILGSRMTELLTYLEGIFDYIIIDTAPVNPVTDAYILSPLCDATLYVIRHGYTPKASVEMIDRNNKVRSLKNLAIVFNGVKARGIGNYGFGYGYGYGTGYGYAEGEEGKGKKKKKGIVA